MQTNHIKVKNKAAARAVGAFFFVAVAAFAQQQVNLTAGPVNLVLPDGSTTPMWGYSCGAAVGGSTATCAKSNPLATGWSPVVITVPTGQGLQVNLTNSLTFGATPNNVPTSLVIVGQLGGGLGIVTQRTVTASPDHSTAQQTTWPIFDAGTKGTPPAQGPRVQSFSTEVAVGATTPLTWTAANLRAGTYLMQSGTHPSIQVPMGLYGMVVVTTAPAGATPGTAYPGVTYNAEVPMLMGEIDPVQNKAVSAAVNTVGFSETKVWNGQVGGCGNPASATYNTCYPPAVNYSPTYYHFNGVAFDKTTASTSMFAAAPATGVTGTVLVRLVNAGSRMHVPTIVGSQTATPAVPGLSLIAEDGNPLPGTARVQNEVFMAAGKVYDVMVNVPATVGTALPVFDRQGSLSGNAASRDAGMLAYISINGAPLPSSPAIAPATANPDTYSSVLGASKPLVVSDPSKGVIANDINVYGVKVLTPPTKGTLTLNANGTFTYLPNAGWSSPDTFVYQANTAGPTATVTLASAPIEAASGIVLSNATYTSRVATQLSIKSPGVLSTARDVAGYPLSINAWTAGPGLTLSMDASGGFNASVPAAGTYTFTYTAKNSQGTVSASSASVTLIFPPARNLQVSVLDGKAKTPVTDYRWIIEEDRTFLIDPANTTTTTTGVVPNLGTNFHTSYMPVVAQGCTGPNSCGSGQTMLDPTTGAHVPAVCDVGNGACRPGAQQAALSPGQVVLDPLKRYYISVFPGDGADPVITGADGHAMGGAPIAAGQTTVTVLVEPTPLPTAQVSAFVFQDDFPLNGEHDAGGGVDVLAPNEAGLGGFNITLFDDVGGPGDAAGQMTYDMFNMPLSNALAGTIDPTTGKDACPIAKQATNDPTQRGITGVVPTCPTFESDGVTMSPLAGQAVIKNLPPGRYGVVANPAADRIAKGEEWLQTNTLDGQKAHDSFIRVSEPSYFQEYGPAGYHVTIGFANPKIINSRKPEICAATTCTNSITGKVTTLRISRTPDERLYSSGSRDSFGFTQCYVSLGDTDGEDFAFTKCAEDGTFTFTGIPDGNWRLTLFDQWNDQIVDGLSTPVAVIGGQNLNMGDVTAGQWHTNIYTRTFFDMNGDGVPQDNERGLSLVPTNIRFRDGSIPYFNNTDLDGSAGFNEIFPLFNWYVVETDSTRYKNTGTHVVYDAGGPADGSPACGQAGNPPCGTSTIGQFMANTRELASLPTNLRFPGSVYCSNADCTGFSIANGPGSSAPPTNLSTGRIDPAWVDSYGWQGFIGQNAFLEFGKKPFIAGENGGIKGHVVYASTRPFDDPSLLLQLSWEPQVPNVTINLYQEGTAADGSKSLKLVDTTLTSSWDDWAQGFRSDGMPNMNCPGQIASDLFIFTLNGQRNFLNPGTALPNNSQFKCFDGMHNWNQLQPAPYDGMYRFPSIIGRNPQTGAPVGAGSINGTPGTRVGSNCTICVANPTDGTPMLPVGKYVVEVVVPPGYELVKEEDKNILLGDSYIGPVTQQFGGLGSIFILPDQAQVGSGYNPNNPQNPTTSLGALPRHEGDTGQIESFWPCVGQARIVPDFVSLFPQSGQLAPFAGATRNLCDRKEVTLDDQSSSMVKFYVFTTTHIAGHYTGIITDDFTSEFDPFAPAFGEKFSPPNLPVAIRDWAGNEISRVYSDQWGVYNGMSFSSYGVNPPDPSGFVPAMMVVCMNDPGPIPGPNGTMIKDPLFNPGYSNFCYELPFMPGQTQYMDTPVVPTSAFSEGYNHPDCEYPDATPAISSVDGDGIGPWVSASGTRTLTIHALGDQVVVNNAYSGPSATVAPFNQKTITRHYGFGATAGTVTIGGVNAAVTSWSDTTIVVTAPTTVPLCALQQQAQYGGSSARCGELLITASNGKQSIDAVTVTIGGKAPTRVTAPATIQAAIDAASPGDLIIVTPGEYNEHLLMWKPVRLQGVGAATSIINANAHPAGVFDAWRRKVVCLFGLAVNGQPYTSASGANPYDSDGDGFSCPNTGWNFFTGAPLKPQVDRIPLEGIVGWDASSNGNLAQMLQEPTLMGAFEGAGITVLGKGVKVPVGANPFGDAGIFPAGTTLLSAADCANGGTNPYPSNFYCNPSSIDGLGITNSSQGGGGIFVHGWGHNLEIANNRVQNNTGTLSGGISVGQGEFPPGYLVGDGSNADPGSCMSESGQPANLQLPYCLDVNVNIHHNAIRTNASTGDELFSATPSGAGGVTFCTGADAYKFNYNWVCGNLSTGDGGGVAHLGFIWNGDIEHNQILFNQSTNPTVPTQGGGLLIMGSAPDGGLCADNNPNDLDCAPGLSDGAGPGLVINANLIQGNAAESGSGGGLRLQFINGVDVGTFPTTPSRWYSVTVTNNIISNNVAGWDGGGVSLQDALVVNFINNTVIANDSTASAGVLFNTLGAPISSSPAPVTTTSTNQAAGFVTTRNTTNLIASLTGSITCPAGHAAGTLNNGSCRQMSYPLLANNLFWQNRAFHIVVGALDTQYQQNVVTITPAMNQPALGATTANGNGAIVSGGTGACVAGGSYWDIGVRGDTGPTNHSSGFTLAPQNSILTSTTGYAASNLASNPTITKQYCNGSRTPPEFGGSGYQVPPGISDATMPNPIFHLTPGATVDEGNNWINIKWGPLALANPVTGVTLANYAPAIGSPAINYIVPVGGSVTPPATDFFGNPRVGNIDVGAIEFTGVGAAPATLNFGNVIINTTSAAQTVTVSNGGPALTSLTVAFTSTYSRPAGAAGGTCGATLGLGASCTINVVFNPTALGAANGTLTITAARATGPVVVSGSPIALTGTGIDGAVSVAPTSLSFGNVNVGATSAAQTVTLTNAGTALTSVGLTFSASFSRPAGVAGGTCGATLAALSTCTVNVVFSPTLGGPASGTLAITAARAAGAVVVTGSPVALTGTGVGSLTVAPTTLAFGNVVQGSTSAAQTLTVSNTTGAAAAIGSTFSTPQYARPAGVPGGTCTASLAANSTCTINVVFAPTTIGAVNGNVTIAAGVTATLTGTGTSPGSFSVAPATLTFSSPLNVTSAAQTTTVTNTDGTVLTISSIAFAGTNPTQFARSGGTCGATLAVGASCTVFTTFTPTTAGAKAATLVVTMAGLPAQSVALTGTIATGSFTVAPATMTFSSPLNVTSAAQTATVTNTDGTVLTISSIAFAGTNPTQFARSGGTCGATLAVGASCTVFTTFTPTTTGNKAATLVVTMAGLPAQSVALTGTIATGSFTAAPATMTFSSPLNVTSAAQTATITNTDGTVLTISSIAFGGTNPTQFARSGGTCGATLAVGASCTVFTTFTPTTTGNKAATLVVTMAGLTAQSIALTGTVTAGPPVLTVTATTAVACSPSPCVNFGNETRGNPPSPIQTVTISNTGGTSLTINSSSLTGTSAAQFIEGFGTCNASGVVAPGTSCTVTLQFNPPTGTTVGTKTATYNLGATPGALTAAISLTGNAQ